MTIGRFKFVIWVHDLDKDFKSLKDMCEKYEWSYYHANHEITPTTGKHHLDGYYEYPTQRKWTTENKKFVKVFGTGYGNLQQASGTAGENDDYSEKEGRERQTSGTPAQGQGFRGDIMQIKNDILAGKVTVDQVAVDDPIKFHQYGRTLSKIEDLALRKQFRSWMTTCEWIYGPTGTGKSARAFEGYNPDTHYLWKDDKGWQDGYVGQPIVIMNDFRGEIPYNSLLQLIDRYPHFVSRRGREPAPFLAKHVIITSSLSPDQVYHRRLEQDSIEQLLRRIKVTYSGG